MMYILLGLGIAIITIGLSVLIDLHKLSDHPYTFKGFIAFCKKYLGLLW